MLLGIALHGFSAITPTAAVGYPLLNTKGTNISSGAGSVFLISLLAMLMIAAAVLQVKLGILGRKASPKPQVSAAVGPGHHASSA